jgi:hypothetical protein
MGVVRQGRAHKQLSDDFVTLLILVNDIDGHKRDGGQRNGAGSVATLQVPSS